MQTNYQQRGWSSQRIAWMIVPALIALAGVAVFTHMAYRRAETDLVIERDRQVVYLSAAQMRDEIYKFADILDALARKPEIYGEDRVAQRQALQQSSLTKEGIFDGGIVILDNFGKVIISEPERPEIIGQDWSDRGYFRQLLSSKAAAFSNALNDGPNASQVVAFSVPIIGEKGEFVGGLVGMFRLGETTVSSFYASIVRLRIGQSGNTYVLDGNGQVLYDSGSSRVGDTLTSLDLPGDVINGRVDALRTSDPDGNSIIAAYAPIPGTPWTLVTEDDWAVLTGSTRLFINILFVLLILGIVLVIVVLALFVRKMSREAVERGIVEQDMGAAHLIQQIFLPKQAPLLPGWDISVHFQSLGMVNGGFYDFILLSDGRLMLTVGDLEDKGLSAAMMKATARAVLRSVARDLLPPAEALAHANYLLLPEMWQGISMTCFYGILDPSSGCLEFANAGHSHPYYSGNGSFGELPVRGAPFGTKLETRYEQSEAVILPGERAIFYSNGIAEARSPEGEKFGVERLGIILEETHGDDRLLIDKLLTGLHEFAGDGWGHDDDIILLVLERAASDDSS